MSEIVKKVERDSSFELLRIVAIIFIILFHAASFGNWNISIPDPEHLPAQLVFIYSLRPLGRIGVDIFILISGYFLYNSFKFKIKKIIKLWLQVFSISVLLGIVFILSGKVEPTEGKIIGILTPVLTGKWWFVRHYLIVLLISPLINLLTERIGNKGHLALVIVCSLLNFGLAWYYSLDIPQYSTLWFTVLFMIGSLMRRNSSKLTVKFYYPLIGAFIVYLVAVILLCQIPKQMFGWDYEVHEMIISVRSPFVLAVAMLIFIAFMNLRIKHNRWINLVASTTFGIYLFHDYPDMRRWLWSDVFDCSSYGSISGMVLYCLYCLGAIFLVFMILEYIRKRTLEEKVVVPLLKE